VGFDWYSFFVSAKTGALKENPFFWQDDSSMESSAQSVFSNAYIADTYSFYGGPAGIGVWKNSNTVNGANYPPPLFTCDAAMLAACADNNNFQFDPSGKYLFIALPNNTTQVLALDVAAKKLKETGATMANAPLLYTFSPDGTLVYSIKYPSEVFIYAFNPADGLFTAHSSFTVASHVNQLVAAKLDYRPAAVKFWTPNHLFVFGVDVAAHAKLRCGPGDCHQKSSGGNTLWLQQRGDQNIRVEDDPNHCSDGRRSRRVVRAAFISASISSMVS
jgi:hypothetical protein